MSRKAKIFIILNGESRPLVLWSYLIGSSIDYVQKDRISFDESIFYLQLQFQNICCNFFYSWKATGTSLFSYGWWLRPGLYSVLSIAFVPCLRRSRLTALGKANGIKGLCFAVFDFFFLTDLFCQPRHLWVIQRGGTHDQCCAVTTPLTKTAGLLC